jgi:hypothetical protein
LNKKSDSFSLPAIKKWARLITDHKNAKGWHNVFNAGTGLFSVLKTVFETIQPTSPGGGSLRDMYADFLEEASPIINQPELNEVANQYRILQDKWLNLSESALPDDIDPFPKFKRLIKRKNEILLDKGNEGVGETTDINGEIKSLTDNLNNEFPMSESEIEDLFNGLQDQLYNLFEAEKSAIASLRTITNEYCGNKGD